MNRKLQILKNTAGNYFITVTLVNIVIFLLGTIFRPDERFGYEAYLSPLIYAAVAFIPLLAFSLLSSGRELTMKQMLLRHILEIIALEVILIFFGFGTESLTAENIPLIAAFALSVLSVYALVTLISWVLDLRTARLINNDLEQFRSRHPEQ